MRLSHAFQKLLSKSNEQTFYCQIIKIFPNIFWWISLSFQLCNFFFCVHFVTSIKGCHFTVIHASHKECFNENCIRNEFQRYVNVSMSSEKMDTDMDMVMKMLGMYTNSDTFCFIITNFWKRVYFQYFSSHHTKYPNIQYI